MDPEGEKKTVITGQLGSGVEKYKRVQIQNLQRKDQPTGKPMPEKIITQKLNEEENQYGYRSKMRDREAYCFKDTGLQERLYQGSNQFFMSFLIPYNQHGDILLVPDNIWLAISFYLSKYIDSNAEKLRHFFVSHEGKKELVVKEYANSVQQSLKMQKEWDYFFEQIIKEVKKNTNEGVVEALACNFSTTTKVYETISTAIIMNSFKKYFEYTRMLCGCGINNVYFDGTRQDWVKVKNKLENLAQYDIDGILKDYVANLSVILDKFIETFDGNVDKNWWNTIIATQQRRGMSGIKGGTYVQGWILQFFGLKRKTHVTNIPSFEISVPIKLINELTKTQKEMELKADWVSVSKVNETTYKPDIGLCILKNSEKKLGQIQEK